MTLKPHDKSYKAGYYSWEGEHSRITYLDWIFD